MPIELPVDPPADPRVEEAMTYNKVAQWLALKREQAALKERINYLRSQLADHVTRNGTWDDRGSAFWELKDPITSGDKSITQLKWERRVSTKVNEAAAEEILKAKGLWEGAVQIITVVDPDAIFGLYTAEQLTESELEKILQQTEVFALKDICDTPAEHDGEQDSREGMAA